MRRPHAHAHTYTFSKPRWGAIAFRLPTHLRRHHQHHHHRTILYVSVRRQTNIRCHPSNQHCILPIVASANHTTPRRPIANSVASPIFAATSDSGRDFSPLLLLPLLPSLPSFLAPPPPSSRCVVVFFHCYSSPYIPHLPTLRKPKPKKKRKFARRNLGTVHAFNQPTNQPNSLTSFHPRSTTPVSCRVVSVGRTSQKTPRTPPPCLALAPNSLWGQ